MFGESDLRCGRCGNSLRAAARFCDACGSPVQPGRALGERKQVTVLFADVAGSMSLAAALDPEPLREIMHDLFNQSAAVVQRYQGTVDKFTGDGLMALFGAPVALEDHALRAGIAALEIQVVAGRLAEEVRRRHRVELLVRVGLNSGEVVAGDIGVGLASYTAVGHPVGMAQRMEAAAAPGTVLCSAAAARLMQRSADFGPVEQVTVKGGAEPVSARRLRAIDPDRMVMGRDAGPLLGRTDDLAILESAFDAGCSAVVGVLGEPGVGKSRLIRELTAYAGSHARIVTARCDSHTAAIPLHALSRLLRAMFGTGGLNAAETGAQIASQLDGVDALDIAERATLFDLMSAGEASSSTTNPDARRRHLIEALTKVTNAAIDRLVFVIEDVHWIDSASEHVIAEFAAALANSTSLVVCTFRPHYQGRLRTLCDPLVTLAPLDALTTLELAAEIIGPHPSARDVIDRIAQPSAGNPFFVEEIVRDLAGRGALSGNRGDYRLSGRLDSIPVPDTVHSVIAARIDRLRVADKSMLNAAAVIGLSFELETLQALLPRADADQVSNLVSAELIDQVRLLPAPRYAFRHPLVRAVAYESQLTTTRADGHRRLATAIETKNPSKCEENSALIAHHMEAAGDPDAAYAWFMRAGEWLRNRDVTGARESWERALTIADRMTDEHEDVTNKRIAPRALLTFTAWQTGSIAGSDRWFDGLRELATQSGDLRSLAMGMAGRLNSLVAAHGMTDETLTMASELLDLVDEVDASASERAEMLLSVAITRYVQGELEQALHATERLRSLGPEISATELVPALCMAGVIKIIIGNASAGQSDLSEGITLARHDHAVIYATAVAWETDLVVLGFRLADGALVEETSHALRAAERDGDTYALSLARWAHGTALLRNSDMQRANALELLHQSCVDGINGVSTWCDAEFSEELARHDQLDGAIDLLAADVRADLDQHERFLVGYPAAVLVRLLLERNGEGDRGRALEIIAQLEAGRAPDVPATHLWPLHCRALLAAATDDLSDRAVSLSSYRDLAASLSASGHLLFAEQMTARMSLNR